MELKDKLSEATKTAMKARETARVSTLRMISSGLKDREIAARGEGAVMSEADQLAFLGKMVKQRQESAKAYEAGNPTHAERAGNVLSYRSENHHESVKWLRIAVDHGYDSAYCSLALIHEDRESPAYDADEAFLCWSKVAERPRGDLRFFAMWRLASCCRDGVGTARNRDEAKRWLDRILAVAPKDKSDYRDALKRKREIDEELL